MCHTMSLSKLIQRTLFTGRKNVYFPNPIEIFPVVE